jgi:hypothetical protein
MHCKLNTNWAQSLGPEKVGPERLLPGLLAPVPVLSPSRITPEYNGKIRPPPDRENAFARASGGADGPEIQPSPRSKNLAVGVAARAGGINPQSFSHIHRT